MMIAGIAVSTMIIVAMVVFAFQYHAFRKNHPKRDQACACKKVVRGTQEAPITS